MAKIYNIKHPNKKFNGHWGPIDFDQGMGSTSSKEDRDRLVNELGCKDITEKQKSK